MSEHEHVFIDDGGLSCLCGRQVGEELFDVRSQLAAARADADNDGNALRVARGMVAFLKSAVMCGEQLTLGSEATVDAALQIIDNQLKAHESLQTGEATDGK